MGRPAHPAVIPLAGLGYIVVGWTRYLSKLLKQRKVTCFKYQERGSSQSRSGPTDAKGVKPKGIWPTGLAKLVEKHPLPIAVERRKNNFCSCL